MKIAVVVNHDTPYKDRLVEVIPYENHEKFLADLLERQCTNLGATSYEIYKDSVHFYWGGYRKLPSVSVYFKEINECTSPQPPSAATVMAKSSPSPDQRATTR